MIRGTLKKSLQYLAVVEFKTGTNLVKSNECVVYHHRTLESQFGFGKSGI